jgi:hypothetical protein
VQKADPSEIVKTGDIVIAAYDLNYGKDHGVVVAGCLGTITDIPNAPHHPPDKLSSSGASSGGAVSSESTASWNVTWHTNRKGSLPEKAKREQFRKCKPTEFLSMGDIVRPSGDLKIALKAIGTSPSVSLPGAPVGGTITITKKDTLGILEKLDVFDPDD